MRELTVGNRCSVRGVATFLPLPRPSSLEGTYFMCIMQNLATTLAPLPSSRECTYFIVYYAKTAKTCYAGRMNIENKLPIQRSEKINKPSCSWLYSEWDFVSLTRDLWLSHGPIENVVASFCIIHMKYVPSFEDQGRHQCCCQFLHNSRAWITWLLLKMGKAPMQCCCQFLHNAQWNTCLLLKRGEAPMLLPVFA